MKPSNIIEDPGWQGPVNSHDTEKRNFNSYVLIRSACVRHAGGIDAVSVSNDFEEQSVASTWLISDYTSPAGSKLDCDGHVNVAMPSRR